MNEGSKSEEKAGDPLSGHPVEHPNTGLRTLWSYRSAIIRPQCSPLIVLLASAR